MSRKSSGGSSSRKRVPIDSFSYLEWVIDDEKYISVLRCMPHPCVRYFIEWAVEGEERRPVAFVVRRQVSPTPWSKGLESGYLDEFNFEVKVGVKCEDVGRKDIPRSSLYTDIEEAKELAWRDFVDNILKNNDAKKMFSKRRRPT